MNMDSYQTLASKGQYELLLNLTKDASDPESSFYQAIALLGLNRPKEALKVLLDEKDALFDYKPSAYIKALMEVRVAISDFEGAESDLKWLENKPYVSQEVEEELRALPKALHDAELSTLRPRRFQEDELPEMLSNPKSDFDLLIALNHLKGTGVGDFTPEILKILPSERPYDIRVFALLLLVSEKYAKPVSFRDEEGKLRTLVPAALEPPFSSSSYFKVKERLSLHKNPSLGSVALSLLDDLCLSFYPDPFPAEGRENIEAEALLLVASSYLGENVEPTLKEEEEEVKERAKTLKARLLETKGLEI